MTKKDYEKAAKIIREYRESAVTDGDTSNNQFAIKLENVFVRFFSDDNPAFDSTRFRAACKGKKK